MVRASCARRARNRELAAQLRRLFSGSGARYIYLALYALNFGQLVLVAVVLYKLVATSFSGRPKKQRQPSAPAANPLHGSVVTCTQCSTALHLPASFDRSRAKCKKCGAVVRVG